MQADFERQLIISCKNGDEAAREQLIKACSPRVFAVCMSVLRHRADAEDAAQQVLLKIITRINALNDGQAFGPWIYRIAKNICIDFIRKRKLSEQNNNKYAADAVGRSSGYDGYGSDSYRRCDKRDSHGVAEDKEQFGRLQDAVNKLSEENRIVIMLYYFDGHNCGKIAKMLEISQSAVQARLYRARKQLYNLLHCKEDNYEK